MSDHNNSYGKTPPISPGVRRNGGGVGRRLDVKVVLLDDKVNGFQVVCRAPAQELFNAVVNKLKLLEMDYFDLEYFDKDGQQAWLDHEKSIPKQVKILYQRGAALYWLRSLRAHGSRDPFCGTGALWGLAKWVFPVSRGSMLAYTYI